MQRTMFLLLAALVAVTIQSTLLHFGLPAPLLPQLGVVLVVFLGFHDISIRGAVLAFVVGLMLDLSTGILVGPWAGALVSVYGGLALLSARLFSESRVVVALVSGCAALLAGGVHLLLRIEYWSAAWSDLWLICGQAATTTLVAPLLLGVVSQRVKRRAQPGPSRSLLAS
jgi:hypothetical protein